MSAPKLLLQGMNYRVTTDFLEIGGEIIPVYGIASFRPSVVFPPVMTSGIFTLGLICIGGLMGMAIDYQSVPEKKGPSAEDIATTWWVLVLIVSASLLWIALLLLRTRKPSHVLAIQKMSGEWTEYTLENKVQLQRMLNALTQACRMSRENHYHVTDARSVHIHGTAKPPKLMP